MTSDRKLRRKPDDEPEDLDDLAQRHVEGRPVDDHHDLHHLGGTDGQ